MAINRDELKKIQKGLIEKAEKFGKGFKITTFEGADIESHMKRGKNVYGKKGTMNQSLFTDKLTNLDCFKYSMNDGYALTDDILYLNYEMSLKDTETSINRGYKRANTSNNKINNKINEVTKKLNEEKEALNNSELLNKLMDKSKKDKQDITMEEVYKKEYNRLRKKKSRGLKDGKDVSDIEKEISTLNREYKTRIKNISKLEDTKEKLEAQVEVAKNKADYLNKKAKDISNTELSDADKLSMTQDEIRFDLTENNIQLTNKVENKEYNKQVNKIKREYKGTENKELRKKLIAEISEPKEIEHVFVYEDIAHASAKGRLGKAIFGLVGEYDTETGEFIREGFTQHPEVMDEFKILAKAQIAYDEYKTALENGVTGKKLEELEKKARYKSVEFGAYDSLEQSSNVKVKYTKGIAKGKELNGYMFFDDLRKEMLVVKDLDADIKCSARVQKLNGVGKLSKIEDIDNYHTKNTLFDGCCLVDESVWNITNNFALLRGKMFKSGATKMPLKKMIKEICEKHGLDYENGYTVDQYGNKKYYKDITFITTDNSTKFDKFDVDIEDWYKVEENRGNAFGIVKTEHKSKFGEQQQQSYQMLNVTNTGDSVEEAKETISKLVKSDLDELKELKDNPQAYINYLKENENAINNNKMMVAIAEKNADFIDNELFRNAKKNDLNSLKRNIKSGKLKFNGDNLIIVPDVQLMIEHALGVAPTKEIEVNGKKKTVLDTSKSQGLFTEYPDSKYVRIYTKKFGYGEKVVLQRSPQALEVSQVLAINCYNPKNPKEIDEYLNENLIIVDETKFAFQDLTAGSDKDSDFFNATNDKELVKCVEKSWGKKRVPINEIPNQPAIYMNCKYDNARKDIAIASSKVGDVSNVYQNAQSHLTHMKLNSNKFNKEQIDEMEKICYRLKVAQDLCIDNAKRISELKLFDYMTEENEMIAKQMSEEIDSLNNEILSSARRSEEYKSILAEIKGKKDKESKEKRAEIKGKNKEEISIRKELREEKKIKIEDRKTFIEENTIKGEITLIQESDCWIRDKDGKIVKADFFSLVGKNKNLKTTKLDCNMDLLGDVVEELDVRQARGNKSVKSKELLVKYNNKNVDGKRILDIVDEFSKKTNVLDGLYAEVRGSSSEEAKDLYKIIENETKEMNRIIAKKELNQDVYVALVGRCLNGNYETKTSMNIMKALYEKDEEMFLACFKEGKKSPINDELKSTIEEGEEVVYNKAISSSNIYKEKCQEAIDRLCEDEKRIFDKFSLGCYDKEGKVKIEEVKKILNEDLPKEEWKKIKDKLNTVKDPKKKQELLSRVNAPAYKSRISRLEAMKENIIIEAEKLKITELDLHKTTYIEGIKEGYYRSIYSIQNNTGIGFNFNKLTDKDIQSILDIGNWKGNLYYELVENHHENFINKCISELQTGLLAGESVNLIAKRLSEQGEHKYKSCERLMRTEVTHYFNRAELKSYKECGLDKYVFLATLDNRTSELCQGLDHKVFNVEDAEEGVNLPPMHPYCRSTTHAYFGKDSLKNMQRRARDKEGNSIIVKNITYKEWYENYIK